MVCQKIKNYNNYLTFWDSISFLYDHESLEVESRDSLMVTWASKGQGLLTPLDE